MPIQSIVIEPINGDSSVVAVDCGTSTPKLSGTVNLTPYINISSFICRNNDVVEVKTLSGNSLLQRLRLEENVLSKNNINSVVTSIFNNRSSIQSNSNKNIDISLSGVRMGKLDRMDRINKVNAYQAQLDKQGFNVLYSVNGETDQLWNGLGSDSNLSTAANWGTNAAPVTYDALYFDGTTRLNVTNDLPEDTELNGITFNPGAGAFTLSGNRFVLTFDGINNNSTNLQTISANMVLSGSNRTINCNSAEITLSGVISGNSSLTKTGVSALRLVNTNTYIGDTYLSAGGVIVHNNNPFGTGTVYCSGGSSNSSRIIVSPGHGSPASITIDNPIFIDGERPDPIFGPNILVNKSTTFNGLITVGATINRVSRLATGVGATMTIRGGISAAPTFGNILTMNGSGTYVIENTPIRWESAANANATPIYSDTGLETVIIKVAGNRFRNIRMGGTLRTDVPFAISGDNIFAGFNRTTPQGLLRPARINLNGNDQVFNNIFTGSFIGVAPVFADLSGNNIYSNSATFANLTASPNGNTTYFGSISGNINLTKTGNAALTLSGSTALGVGPRYTGFTAISAGTLINYALSSNPSNKVDFASFTRTTLSVTFTTPPSIGDTFTLLPGPTINTYPAVSLTNGGGRTGTYNSTNSRLTIS